MKILITGVAGFIGSHVAEAYLNNGHEVFGIDDLSTGDLNNIDSSVKFYQENICSDNIAKIFKEVKPDVINHHAAQVSVPRSVKEPQHDLRVNVFGLLNVLNSAVENGAKKIIFVSSGGAVYGEAREYPTSEVYIPEPLSVYAINKLTGENYVKYFKHQYNLDYTILRYANVYGPRQKPHGEAGVVALFINQLLSGMQPKINRYDDQPLGMIRDYVFVSDVVSANLAALSKGNNDCFNIGTGVETDTCTLYKSIAMKLNSDVQPLFDVARAGDIKRSLLNCDKAKSYLDWQYKEPLSDGISKTIDYIIKNQRG